MSHPRQYGAPLVFTVACTRFVGADAPTGDVVRAQLATTSNAIRNGAGARTRPPRVSERER
jgi:hypothetical protein